MPTIQLIADVPNCFHAVLGLGDVETHRLGLLAFRGEYHTTIVLPWTAHCLL